MSLHFRLIPHNLLGETHTGEQWSGNITSNWIFHGTKFIPRNSIRIVALEVATTCSQKPSCHHPHLTKIMQEICGRRGNRVHVIYPHLSRTRVVTGRNACFTSPLSRARPFKCIKRRWKMISLHGGVYYSTARTKSY